MATGRKGTVAISEPTTTFLRIVERAASDCRDKSMFAKEKLITKLKFTNSYAAARKYSAYHSHFICFLTKRHLDHLLF